MSRIIENPKEYSGEELASIFFRPMLGDPDARDLGIKIMYNMPVPTILSFWESTGDVLKNFRSGWTGGGPSVKFQKKSN